MLEEITTPREQIPTVEFNEDLNELMDSLGRTLEKEGRCKLEFNDTQLKPLIPQVINSARRQAGEGDVDLKGIDIKIKEEKCHTRLLVGATGGNVSIKFVLENSDEISGAIKTTELVTNPKSRFPVNIQSMAEKELGGHSVDRGFRNFFFDRIDNMKIEGVKLEGLGLRITPEDKLRIDLIKEGFQPQEVRPSKKGDEGITQTIEELPASQDMGITQPVRVGGESSEVVTPPTLPEESEAKTTSETGLRELKPEEIGEGVDYYQLVKIRHPQGEEHYNLYFGEKGELKFYKNCGRDGTKEMGKKPISLVRKYDDVDSAEEQIKNIIETARTNNQVVELPIYFGMSNPEMVKLDKEKVLVFAEAPSEPSTVKPPKPEEGEKRSGKEGTRTTVDYFLGAKPEDRRIVKVKRSEKDDGSKDSYNFYQFRKLEDGRVKVFGFTFYPQDKKIFPHRWWYISDTDNMEEALEHKISEIMGEEDLFKVEHIDKLSGDLGKRIREAEIVKKDNKKKKET